MTHNDQVMAVPPLPRESACPLRGPGTWAALRSASRGLVRLGLLANLSRGRERWAALGARDGWWPLGAPASHGDDVGMTNLVNDPFYNGESLICDCGS